MKPYTYLLITAILIGAVYLAGCTARVPSPSPIPTISETATPEPSLTPSPTLTPTATRTARPTATTSREPLPTLPPAEALEKVRELLETNGGCTFPCWWGITPGETNWEEVVDTLQPIAWRISSFKDHPVYKDKVTREFYFAIDDQPTLMNSLMVIFVLEKETLEVEWIVSGQPFNIEELLLSFGVPEEIWVTADGIPVTGPVVYSIDLFYSQIGIMTGISNYAEMIHKNGEDFALICNSALIDDAFGLLFFPPDTRMDYQEFYIEDKRPNEFLPIQTATNMTPEDFYDLVLSGGPNECFEIPMSNWDY